jgi:hypothetical protein
LRNFCARQTNESPLLRQIRRRSKDHLTSDKTKYFRKRFGARHLRFWSKASPGHDVVVLVIGYWHGYDDEFALA